jgi:hypothetical protein
MNMNRVSITSRVILYTLAGLIVPAGVWAASLNVYSIHIVPGTNPITWQDYLVSPPYISWDPPTITGKLGQWTPANQFLLIRTDMKYNTSCRNAQGNSNGSCVLNSQPTCSGGNCWGIQIFTDNTQIADATGPSFHIPDTINSSGKTVEGGTVQGALSPAYTGYQSILSGSQVALPKGGLVSANGQERLPLIWHDYISLPLNRVPGPITETPGTLCDFNYNAPVDGCAWAYFLDKGDQVLPGSGGRPQSNWTNGLDYVVPVNQYGGQATIGSRFQPLGDDDGGHVCDTAGTSLCYSNDYLYVAANFRNATTQVYSTTIFVELYVL